MKKVKFKLKAGRHKIGKETIKAGEIFSEYPENVEWMKERVERVDPISKEEVEESRTDIEKMRIEAVHRASGRYRVEDVSTGEPIHDGLLSAEEAEELVSKMVEDGIAIDASEEDEDEAKDTDEE